MVVSFCQPGSVHGEGETREYDTGSWGIGWYCRYILLSSPISQLRIEHRGIVERELVVVSEKIFLHLSGRSFSL